MTAYRVLFVEKAPAESSMASLLDWETLGFTLTGTVASEKQALAVITAERPDVVVTELALAAGSGLALIRQAKAAVPDTAFVILAPEGRFEAAQEAIMLGVAAFLTRPEDPAVLRRTFIQLRQTLQQKHVQAANWTALQQFYKQSLPVMQASFYAALIDGRIPQGSLTVYQRDYQIDLAGPYYTCLVVHTSTKQLPPGTDPMLLRTRVLEQAQTFFATLWSAAAFSYLGNTVLVVQLANAAARDTTSAVMMREAKAYVRAHYQEEALGLKDICAALGVSTSYFSTLFKREMGVSFITYLTDFRLNLAARLLLETTEKSQVIGHLCGYADPNYFSLVFKKHFGDSPTAYRGGMVAAVQ